MLPRAFFERDADAVAREVIGATLVVDAGTGDEVRATVVEVEAYLGAADPASHAARGPTPRSAVMFGPPGRLYVYLSYGVHHCANLVCSSPGTASAVLLRAASLERGDHIVRARRGGAVARHRLLSGPGNLCRGLALAATDNAADICGAGRLHLEAAPAPVAVATGPRIGISRAVDVALRFWDPTSPAVSGRRAYAPTTKEGTGISAGP